MERWLTGSCENYIYYYYDESGVCGICYNDSEYYYRKNIFGDVIEIYDDTAILQCRYVYDAWGNHKIYNSSGNEITTDTTYIGNINPIRYRGYYYDVEFNLYYLQSRYYDPKVGRFISSDNVAYLEPTNVRGLNLYAYCMNNPVMGCDPSGTVAISALIVGVGLSLLFTGIKDCSNDGELFNGDVSGLEYFGSAITGLIGGAAGQAGSALVRFGGAIGAEVIGGIIAENTNYSMSSLQEDVIMGLTSFGIAESMNILGRRIARTIYKAGYVNASKEGQKQLSRFFNSGKLSNLSNNSALEVIGNLNKFIKRFEILKTIPGYLYSFSAINGTIINL